jgi:hypothetical protein
MTMLTIDDRTEITETLALHAHIFDTHQLDRLDELFTPDAIYDMRPVGIGVYEGIDVIRAAGAQMANSGRAPLAHYVTNIVLTTSTNNDTVTAQSKGLMIMGSGAIQGVTHEDTLRRHHGSWRISRRTVTPARAGTAPGDSH